MSMRPLACAMVLLSGLLVAGCDDPLAPGDVAGTYVLRSVAGEALPAVLYATEDVTVTVLADTLRLNADGTGTHAAVQTYVYATGGGSEDPEHYESELGFTISDDRIEISWLCPDGALTLCVDGPHMSGVRTGEGIRLEAVITGREPLEYQAVNP